MIKRIKIKVVACNQPACGFKVTYDSIGVQAMEGHYKVSHEDVEFRWWESMHAEDMTL